MWDRTRAKTAPSGALQPLPFAVALGHRLRQVREAAGDTAADVAARSRLVGLAWDRSTVARIELGQRQVTAAELLLASLIYDTAVADLLPTEAARLSERTSAAPPAMRGCLTARVTGGFEVDGLGGLVSEGMDRMRPALAAAGARLPGAAAISILGAATHVSDEATGKAARRLAATAEEVAVAAQTLWHRSLTAERDARVEAKGQASARVRQARRGHVTRALVEELAPMVKQVRTGEQEVLRNGER